MPANPGAAAAADSGHGFAYGMRRVHHPSSTRSQEEIMRRCAPFAHLSALLASVVIPCALGAQVFQGKVTYNVSAQGRNMQMVHYIEGSNIRMELAFQGRSMVMLTDAEGARQIMLMPETKQWVDVKAMQEQMAAMMGGRMGRGGDAEPSASGPVDVRPTGRTETVAGIECEHVSIVGDGVEVDVCAAKGLGWHSGAAPSMDGMGSMGMGMGGRGRGMGGPETPSGISPAQMAVLRERFADGFFPLKITTVQGGENAVIEVVSLERGDLDDALFRPPSDYQEIRMPGGFR
jgi:hypothetical protein